MPLFEEMVLLAVRSRGAKRYLKKLWDGSAFHLSSIVYPKVFSHVLLSLLNWMAKFSQLFNLDWDLKDDGTSQAFRSGRFLVAGNALQYASPRLCADREVCRYDGKT